MTHVEFVQWLEGFLEGVSHSVNPDEDLIASNIICDIQEKILKIEPDTSLGASPVPLPTTPPVNPFVYPKWSPNTSPIPWNKQVLYGPVSTKTSFEDEAPKR